MATEKTIPLFRTFAALTLLVIACELAGIWSELKGLREEQVKNAVYSMRPDQLDRIRAMPNANIRLRFLSGKSTVDVDDTAPVSVKIEP